MQDPAVPDLDLKQEGGEKRRAQRERAQSAAARTADHLY